MTDDRFKPNDEQTSRGMVTRCAVQCGICQSPADRYGNRFECQANPSHVADLNTGIFSDLTHPSEVPPRAVVVSVVSQGDRMAIVVPTPEDVGYIIRALEHYERTNADGLDGRLDRELTTQIRRSAIGGP